MLRLTVLGACGTWPAPGLACSGYLLEAAGPGGTGRLVRVWVDAGPGTFAALQRLVLPGALDAVWVSHLHSDHVTDLAVCYHYLRFGPHRRPAGRLAVYGPPGWPEHLNRFLAIPGARGPGGPDPVGAVFALALGLALAACLRSATGAPPPNPLTTPARRFPAAGCCR